MFSCTGYPGYPDGQIMWRIKHENETAFRNFDFYSQYSNISDDNCRRKEINNVPFQFDMSWNNTLVRCYIETTDYYAEGQIRLLPCKYKTNRPQLFEKIYACYMQYVQQYQTRLIQQTYYNTCIRQKKNENVKMGFEPPPCEVIYQKVLIHSVSYYYSLLFTDINGKFSVLLVYFREYT